MLDWLSSYFMHARMSDKQLASFGLMAKWGRYVSHVSFLMGSLIRGYVVKVVNGAGDMNPYHGEDFMVVWNDSIDRAGHCVTQCQTFLSWGISVHQV